jgi:LysM repeat protein
LRQELPPCSSGVYWEVARGDTLFKIAQAVEVPLADLLTANPNVDPQNLRIGQPICIPEGGLDLPSLITLPKCPGGIYWEITPGDTLYEIARINKTTVRRIIAANPGINPNNLRVGQFICIPS